VGCFQAELHRSFAAKSAAQDDRGLAIPRLFRTHFELLIIGTAEDCALRFADLFLYTSFSRHCRAGLSHFAATRLEHSFVAALGLIVEFATTYALSARINSWPSRSIDSLALKSGI